MDWDKLLNGLLKEAKNEVLEFALDELKKFFEGADLVSGESVLPVIASIVLEMIEHKGKLTSDMRALIQQRIASIEMGFKPEEGSDA